MPDIYLHGQSPPSTTSSCDLSLLSHLSDFRLMSGSFTTSSSTLSTYEEGPGTLAGKSIHRLGVQMLKGWGNLIITTRRLSTIAAQSPYRVNLKMCKDILELCRPELYPGTIKSRAKQLLERQIISGQTQYLLGTLQAWPDIEIRILFLELIRNCQDHLVG
ncbi:hypothetical protein K435DRAFT_837372 [Dendrothele bispora CBS 962.96]|uniref:Uncharacterized protein n=1 Tax=Dendrothele bispora (strain CBS 962.96) TaxID=1314807 RepID=A0A4V4HGV3_DENBC|nr:hypothetical protein K435DRAFT_837372 [Dendrothele bispora CBS 962.96]